MSRNSRRLGVGLTIAAVMAVTVPVGVSRAQEAGKSPPITVVHCPALIDSLEGRLLTQTSVVVSGDRIAEVTPGFVDRPGARVIELPAGETCMPGLIDAHTHVSFQEQGSAPTDFLTLNPADWAIRSTVWARRTLLTGFTTIRNVGDGNYETLSLRNEINEGSVPGPRIFSAGPPLTSTGGHADRTDGLSLEYQIVNQDNKSIIDSPDAGRKAVRLHYKQNVDLIKIMASGGNADRGTNGDGPQMTIEEIEAVVQTAHDYGLTVAAHAHGAEAIRRAVLGGVDSIEHGTYMTDEARQLMKARGTYYVPTIYATRYRMDQASVPGRYPPQVVAKILKKGMVKWETVRKAFNAGVNMAYGTDAGDFAHGDNWKDFPLLVEAGVPPSYTIKMATINAAKLLRKDADLGSVTAGKYADIVAVPGDPLKDITLMGKVDFVMKSGVLYKKNGVEIDVPSSH